MMTITYADYPRSKPKDAYIMIGTTKVKLPPPRWYLYPMGRQVECSYHVDRREGRDDYAALIRFHAATHCGEPIILWVGGAARGWDVDPSYSAGGVADKAHTVELAAVMASLWKVASICTQRILTEALAMQMVARALKASP